MLNKKYKFSYGNSKASNIFKCILSYLYQIFMYAGILLILNLLFMYLFANVMQPYFPDIITHIFCLVFAVLIGTLHVFFFVILVMPKRVVLTEKIININRYALPLRKYKRGINDHIPYTQIKSVELCSESERAVIGLAPVPFKCFNKYNIVIITDKFGEKYYIPIEKPEEFILDVLSKIEQ